MGKPLPGYRAFHDPIIEVLGLITKNRDGIYVPFSPNLIKMVIRAAGFDPDNLGRYGNPALGWCYGGLTKPAGFRRKIVLAYQDLHTRVKVPLTVKGAHMQWALTPAGLERLQQLRAEAKGRPNRTSQFLDQKLRDKTVMPYFRSVIGKSMPVSASSAMIDDHIQNGLLRFITRDAFCGRILMGYPIMNHHIAQWLSRSAYTDARNDGTEPVAREFYGARTESERTKTTASPTPVASVQVLPDQRVVWGKEEEGVAGVWVDIVDTDAGETEDTLAFATIWQRVGDKIKAKTVSGERYVNILEMRLQGLSVQEIAGELSVSKHRAATLIAEARKIAQDAWRELQGSLGVLSPLPC